MHCTRSLTDQSFHDASIRRRLLRRRSGADTVIRPSRFRVRQMVVPLPARVSLIDGIGRHTELPTSKQSHPWLLVAQTDPYTRDCPLNPIFMPGGAPKAHEVLSKM